MVKKAQATAVATLVLLMALFILFYVLLIPPPERAKLLGEEPSDNGVIGGGNLPLPGKTLLSVSPGLVLSFSEGEIIKEISPITLFSKVDEDTRNLASTLSLSSNFFSDDSRNLAFNVLDTDKVESAELFFFVKEARGELVVSLNDQIVFEGEVSQNDVPISLPTALLEKTNNLKLYVNRGFSGSDYTLREIKVITSNKVESKLASRNFVLTELEKDSLDRVRLEYFVNCQSFDIGNQGLLTLLLNNRILFSDFVVCGSGLQSFDIAKNRLSEGNNDLEFRIDKGDYILEDIVLRMDVASGRFPSYSFEVDDDSFNKIFTRCYNECVNDCDVFCENDDVCFTTCGDSCKVNCGNRLAILTLKFGDINEKKKAAITINEFVVGVNTFDRIYERDVTNYLRRGANSIKIVPRNDFEIEHMSIFVD